MREELTNLCRFYGDHVPTLLEARHEYAVLCPLVERPDGLHLLFEVRSAGVSQSGETCFPGGQMEPGETPADCALRETEEELSIPRAEIRLLGQGDFICNQRGFLLRPYLGLISPEGYAAISPSSAEVAEVFTVANAAPIFMRLQSFIDRMNVVLRENIVGVRVIRAFNKERHEEQRLDEVFSDYAANAIKVNHLFVGLDSSSFFLMNIAEVAVLWVGGNRVGVHAMQIGSISAVLEYAILILFFVMTAQMVILTLPRAAACLNRAQQVLEIEPSIVDGKRTLDTCAAESVDGADAVAVFDHMSFRFDDADEDTLCDLSFACRRSQTTAIVGSTGSGKSTVAKLLLRFHDATKGAIRLNGIDLRDLSQDDIRGRIAYVPQKAWLFSGTVASNLRFGNEDATEADMLHALEVAQSTFVLDQPQGLDTPVAQGGTNFSGGQRQRLAIARALMKHADLYIFDDSFSALDFKTDAALRHALQDETCDAAVLIIAQRISSVQDADRILVLDNGQINGLGTHEELLKTNKIYQEVYNSQTQGGGDFDKQGGEQ